MPKDGSPSRTGSRGKRLAPRSAAIAAKRESLGRTQKDLAKRAGISQATLSRIENGGRGDADVLRRIADAFGEPVGNYARDPARGDWAISRIDRAKRSILKGLVSQKFPSDILFLAGGETREDVRDRVELQWKDAEYDSLNLTPEETDAVWKSLADDGIIVRFEMEIDGQYYIGVPTLAEFEHLAILDRANWKNLILLAVSLPQDERERLVEDLRVFKASGASCSAES